MAHPAGKSDLDFPRLGFGCRLATLDVIAGTIADGTTAVLITLAMCFGLIIPKLVIDRFSERLRSVKPYHRSRLSP